MPGTDRNISPIGSTPADSGATLVDVFDTAGLRAAVLATWRRSPARFREDANAEEALALVGYSDRVLVELAANAVDAARAAGVPALLRVRVVGDELRVANTGAPLTAEGVAALASLRASAKRDDHGGIGRFGVGFSAVLAVTDAPAVHSVTGGVRFSAIETDFAVRTLDVDALTDELDRRAGRVPVLRLPWPAEGAPPVGYATEVRLPLRADLIPPEAMTALLAQVGDHLLLALPGLSEIDLPDRVLRRDDSGDTATITDAEAVTRWRLLHRSGAWPADVLAGLPVEQRGRTGWTLTWAVPDRPHAVDVLYSPTPTDETLDLPARLIATFPVDETRRHVVTGAGTDLLVDLAADAYVDLMAGTPATGRLALLPTAGFGRSDLDTRLRAAIWDRVRTTPLLVTVSGESVSVERAVLLPGGSPVLLSLAADAIPGLLPAPSGSVEREALRALGVRVLGYAELSGALAALDREPAYWGRLYGALDPGSGDELADLPVPLLDGRMAIGARGALLPPAGSAEWLSRVGAVIDGLRVIHPDAVADGAARLLLARIGATPADPTAVLTDPALTGRLTDLRHDLDDDAVDPDELTELADAVLALVDAGAVVPASVRADLLLTDEDDEPWPAAELLLPGAALAAVLAADADLPTLHPRWTGHRAELLTAVGVLDGFRVLIDRGTGDGSADSAADLEALEALPDLDRYRAEIGDPADGWSAVADLDLVDESAWPAALAMILADPPARVALLPGPDGRLSYTGWWISRQARLDGRPPREWRWPEAMVLAGLYEPLVARIAGLGPVAAAAIGVRTTLAGALADDPADVISRLTDPTRSVAPSRVTELTAAIVGALAAVDGDESVRLPDRMRTLAGTVVDADDVLVLDVPWLAQVLAAAETVPGGADPEATAALLELDLASEVLSFDVIATDTAADATALSRATAIAAEIADVTVDLGAVVVHPELSVRDADGTRRVGWWVRGRTGYVDGTATGWGRLIAYRAGRWDRRHHAVAAWTGDPVELLESAIGAEQPAAAQSPPLTGTTTPVR